MNTIEDDMRVALQSGKWMVAIFCVKGGDIIGRAHQRGFPTDDFKRTVPDFKRMMVDLAERKDTPILPFTNQEYPSNTL